ncbi:c-type cytochrome biogenesis protein CcmI [Zhongshania sp. BJYM1]|uniref:c-type cytochrome biogenesis protein CcmI n=1 Tax=Zhongshania aquatica TaxID=2965069 RepID=UPI0022B5CA54|nr:c-type cytochrome biogenesis protein CcmI [Marortus sp. BJYM1]
MISLYIGLAILLLLAGILILLALRNRGANQADHQMHRRAQRDFYHQRQRELQNDVESGLIDQEQYADLERELDRQLVSESAADLQLNSSIAKRGYIIAVLVLIPVIAIVLYDRLGYRQDLALRELQAEIVSEGIDDARWGRYKDIVDGILARRPDSGEHLIMMATLYRQQGDFAGALPYYQRLEALYPQDPDVLAQLAQARYLVADRQIDDKTRQLLTQALAINPQQGTALGVLGIDAFASGNYVEALTHWQKLLAQLPPGSAEAKVISGGVAESKRLAGAAGDLQSIAVNVAVAPELGATPPGVLFVVAKSTDGNPMPVAALRFPLLIDQDWPINLQLTDADVIRQGMTLSDFKELTLSAHISRAGTAIRRDGDWVGTPINIDTGDLGEAISLSISGVQGK